MELWKDRPISQRIIMAFFTVILFSALLTLITIVGAIGIARNNRAVIEGHEERTYLIELDAAIKDAEGKAGYLKRIVLNRPEDLTPADDMTIKLMAIRIEEAAKKIRPTMGKMLLPRQFNDFDNMLNKALDSMAKWESARNYPTLVAITGALEELKFLSGELQPKLLARINKDLNRANAAITWTSILIVVFSLIIVVVLLVLILPVVRELRRVFTPLREASETALRGAKNVLSYAGEINELIFQLQKAMDEVGRAAQEVAAGAQESANLLGKITEEVKNTSESTGRLSDEAVTIYDSLNTHQALLEEREKQIKEMVARVQELLAGVGQNAEIAEVLTGQVTALREQLAGIEGFLAAMNDITDQTELLALNASIEAARAGESGVGFMVVADRLRKLSEQTKGFTTQIEATVANLHESITKVTMTLSDIITNIRTAVGQVSNIAHEFSSMGELLTNLQQAHGRIISAASTQMEKTREIYRSTTQIMHAVENISAQTEEVSAAMEELSAESEQLIGQIQHLNRNMEETRAIIERQVELARMTKEAAERF